MQIGSPKIVVVMMRVPVMLVVAVRRSRKYPGAQSIYDKSDNGDDQRLVVRDFHGGDES